MASITLDDRRSADIRMTNAAREAGFVPRRIHLVVAIDRLLVGDAVWRLRRSVRYSAERTATSEKRSARFCRPNATSPCLLDALRGALASAQAAVPAQPEGQDE